MPKSTHHPQQNGEINDDAQSGSIATVTTTNDTSSSLPAHDRQQQQQTSSNNKKKTMNATNSKNSNNSVANLSIANNNNNSSMTDGGGDGALATAIGVSTTPIPVGGLTTTSSSFSAAAAAGGRHNDNNNINNNSISNINNNSISNINIINKQQQKSMSSTPAPNNNNSTAKGTNDVSDLGLDIIPQQNSSHRLSFLLMTSEGRDKMFKSVQYVLKVAVWVFLRKDVLPDSVTSDTRMYWTRRFHRNYETIRAGRALFKLARWVFPILELGHLLKTVWTLRMQRLELQQQQKELQQQQQQMAKETGEEKEKSVEVQENEQQQQQQQMQQHQKSMQYNYFVLATLTIRCLLSTFRCVLRDMSFLVSKDFFSLGSTAASLPAGIDTVTVFFWLASVICDWLLLAHRLSLHTGGKKSGWWPDANRIPCHCPSFVREHCYDRLEFPPTDISKGCPAPHTAQSFAEATSPLDFTLTCRFCGYTCTLRELQERGRCRIAAEKGGEGNNKALEGGCDGGATGAGDVDSTAAGPGPSGVVAGPAAQSNRGGVLLIPEIARRIQSTYYTWKNHSNLYHTSVMLLKSTCDIHIGWTFATALARRGGLRWSDYARGEGDHDDETVSKYDPFLYDRKLSANLSGCVSAFVGLYRAWLTAPS